ncbi:MAG TPA: hypothetical protein VGH13_06905 [Xanthobacteraceae bacterium]|jgi:hypothetical protein
MTKRSVKFGSILPELLATPVADEYYKDPIERTWAFSNVLNADLMGREGLGRRHANYKMVAMVLGTNIVRKELGLPEAECLAADARYSLTLTKSS